MPESSRVKRRQWREEFKRQIVAEASAPGVSVASVARRYELNANLIFNWRRRYGGTGAFLPVQVVPDGPLLPGPVGDANAAAAMPEAVAPERVGITLTNGRHLDIGLSIDEASLARLVRVLERA